MESRGFALAVTVTFKEQKEKKRTKKKKEKRKRLSERACVSANLHWSRSIKDRLLHLRLHVLPGRRVLLLLLGIISIWLLHHGLLLSIASHGLWSRIRSMLLLLRQLLLLALQEKRSEGERKKRKKTKALRRTAVAVAAAGWHMGSD
jgi:hypothetical protein